HVLAEECHPRRAVSLFEVPTGGQRRTAVKDANVVQPEKPPFKQVIAKTILAVHPPAKVKHELHEGTLEKLQVALALQRLLCAVQEERGPCVDGRIDVAEVPLVGRNLAGRVEEEFLEH